MKSFVERWNEKTEEERAELLRLIFTINSTEDLR